MSPNFRVARGDRGYPRLGGIAVIDMRYENPLYMVEDAGAADFISGWRGRHHRFSLRRHRIQPGLDGGSRLRDRGLDLKA